MTIDYLRSFRIGPFAIFDFALAYVGVFLLAPVLSKIVSYVGITVTRTQWMLLTLPISIIVHLAIGRHTPLVVMFLDPSGHYIIKLVVIVMMIAAYFLRP